MTRQKRRVAVDQLTERAPARFATGYVNRQHIAYGQGPSEHTRHLNARALRAMGLSIGWAEHQRRLQRGQQVRNRKVSQMPAAAFE